MKCSRCRKHFFQIKAIYKACGTCRFKCTLRKDRQRSQDEKGEYITYFLYFSLD